MYHYHEIDTQSYSTWPGGTSTHGAQLRQLQVGDEGHPRRAPVPRRHRPPRLFLNPQMSAIDSENWSGDELLGSNFTSVSGTFTVPTPNNDET